MEEKSAITTTKRRRHEGAFLAGRPRAATNPMAFSRAISHRLNRLSKRLREKVPIHMIQSSLGTAFPSLSTTGTALDILSGIAQGDNYDSRFSTTVIGRRVIIRGAIVPGSAGNNVSLVRITCYRGQAGLGFAANMTGSYSPVVTSTSTRLIFDKFFQIGGTQNPPFPVLLNFSIKLNHRQKYNGTGAGSTTGESIYIIMQSNIAAGTGAPVVSGVMEVYFDPL